MMEESKTTPTLVGTTVFRSTSLESSFWSQLRKTCSCFFTARTNTNARNHAIGNVGLRRQSPHPHPPMHQRQRSNPAPHQPHHLHPLPPPHAHSNPLLLLLVPLWMVSVTWTNSIM